MKVLKSTTQTLTNVFTNIGPTISPISFDVSINETLSNFGLLTLGFQVTFNDSRDFEVRANAIDIDDPAVAEYELPLDTPKKTIVENNPLVETRKGGTDFNALFGIPVGLTVDAVQVQVRVKTVGAIAGVITRAVYNVGYTQ